jgi:hypothetical protein
VIATFVAVLAAGHFPAGFNEAFVAPIVKEPGVNAIHFRPFRPNSNLSLLSKLRERLVVRQLMDYYLTSADLLLYSRDQYGHESGRIH